MPQQNFSGSQTKAHYHLPHEEIYLKTPKEKKIETPSPYRYTLHTMGSVVQHL